MSENIFEFNLYVYYVSVPYEVTGHWFIYLLKPILLAFGEFWTLDIQ